MDIRANLAIIPDPRIERRKKHLLTDILLLYIIAMTCGVECIEDIALFGITRIQWLKQYLALPNGIPSADTILRVLARIDHTKFEECLLNWTQGYFRERVQPGYGIAIDGKTVRGSASDTEKGIHLASAWANELGLVLGQVRTKVRRPPGNPMRSPPSPNCLPPWIWQAVLLLLTLRTKVRRLSETNRR
jgi:hypothetical protein